MMKKILVATDFSPAALNAAEYAVGLAEVMEAQIALCTVLPLPLPTLTPAGIDYPLADHQHMLDDALERLRVLRAKLGFPAVGPGDTSMLSPGDLKVEVGSAEAQIKLLMQNGTYEMVVLGHLDQGGIRRFLIGSTGAGLISADVGPLLLVPKNARFHPLKKLFFATDLLESDIPVLRKLADLAALTNADLHIVHVVENSGEKNNESEKISRFLEKVRENISYKRIHFQNVYNSSAENGLDWLLEHVTVDILAVVHRRHSYLETLFFGSHSQRIAKHTSIPLLIIPASPVPIVNI